jgi:hypothetical protein
MFMPTYIAVRSRSAITVAAIAFAFLLSFGTSGCVSFISAKKGDSTKKASDAAIKALIKAKTGSHALTDPGPDRKDRNNREGTQIDSRPADLKLPGGTKKDVYEALNTKARNVASPLKGATESKKLTGGQAFKTVDEIFPATSGDPISAKKGKENDSRKGSSNKPTFKKHNHSAYVRKVATKAGKMVRKVRPSLYAALCRDEITDEWSLAMYTKRGKNYVYSVYVWDGIDEKWHRSFLSGGRPMKSLKRHLKVLSSGKECRILKNSLK